MRRIAAVFVAKAGAPLRENAGLKVYAHPSAHKCYPEQILAGELAGGEPVFIDCFAMNEPYATCNAYFHAPGRAYTLSMVLTPARLPQWRELVQKVAALVESWRHAAR